MSYYVYILYSKASGKYYTGMSQNPSLRLQYHNTVEKGFTARYRPWEIVYSKGYDTKGEALSCEKKIKGWKSRVMIEKLIEGKIDL